MTVTLGPACFDLIPFGMSVPGLLWMGFAILLAAFVRGYSGFGFSALTIAASSLVTNPLHFVAVVTVCEAVSTLQ
ncbi:MAG: hypothetical protein EBU97_05035, partial [Rhodobacteraceae bacterium]|nr:hypothetical protein [Paracoccaceae bacterium]